MKKNIIICLITILLCSIIFFLINKSSHKDKIGWVNITKVYSDFVFKKELETKITKTQQARKAITDSLEFELKMLSREIKSENGKDQSKVSRFELKRENYIEKKKEFEEDNEMLQKQYNDQILTQINQYLKDYGKQKDYQYILGADGGGMLMYAIETSDITDEVIQYINERYKGKTE